MATRGAVAAACIWRSGRNRSISSLSRNLNPKFARCSFNSPQVLTSNRTRQTGFKFPIRAIQGAAADTISPKKSDEEQSSKNWKIKMLYDGDCPLCMREVNMLRERNKQYGGTIKFVDISSDDYSPEDNQGLDYETVMGKIHAILSDGSIVTNVEAFKRLYEQVGLGWVYAITKYEPIAKIADAVYGVWAKYRLQITGRPPMEEILQARRNKAETCRDNSCKM